MRTDKSSRCFIFTETATIDLVTFLFYDALIIELIKIGMLSPTRWQFSRGCRPSPMDYFLCWDGKLVAAVMKEISTLADRYNELWGSAGTSLFVARNCTVQCISWLVPKWKMYFRPLLWDTYWEGTRAKSEHKMESMMYYLFWRQSQLCSCDRKLNKAKCIIGTSLMGKTLYIASRSKKDF